MFDSNALAVVRRHGAAMSSKDPEYIVKDYAENAVVITNLVEKPAVGRAEIREAIAQCLQYDVLVNEDVVTRDVRDTVEGNRVLHVFEKPEAGAFGVETYIVENDKIVFETAYIRMEGAPE